MEVSEGFQVYCREGATHWREFKSWIGRELKLNGISTENHGWRNCCRQPSQDLWKMEFRTWKVPGRDMEVDGNEVVDQ